jgi:hypothetical protein
MKRFIVVFVAVAGYAFAGSNCQHVGGAVLTNFIDPTTTFGTATGGLGGAVGVSVLSLKENPDGSLTFHNQHHWVTTSGDTIQTADAYATGYPTPVPGLFAALYTNGMKITGGTGRFAGATGHIAVFGAVDTQKAEIILRYAGKVCFAESEDPEASSGLSP